MARRMVQNPPAGFHTVNAYPMLDDPRGFMEFLKTVFGATQNGGVAEDADGNVMHADFQIGDSHVMFGGSTPSWPQTNVSLYCYIDDVDGVHAKAMAFGCTSIREPTTEFYGDRVGGFRDPFGNTWMVGAHLEDVPEEEMQRRMQAYLAQASS